MKRVSVVLTQAHTNPFAADRQNPTNSAKRTSMTQPVSKFITTTLKRKTFETPATDPLAQNNNVETVTATPVQRTIVAPFHTKDCVPLTLREPSRGRSSSAPAGSRSVLAPESLPRPEPVKRPHPSLSAAGSGMHGGVFQVAKQQSRPAVIVAPFARNTPRAMTPNSRRSPPAPYSTNTPRPVTPLPNRAASKAPYSQATPRAATPTGTYRPTAPYHSNTPRVAATKVAHKVVAPFA